MSTIDDAIVALRELIKSVVIEAAEERPDLFGHTTIQQKLGSEAPLSSSEAAKFLRISIKKLYQLRESGVIQSFRSGRKHLFDRKELVKSLKKQKPDKW